jgi:hypothetical protein
MTSETVKVQATERYGQDRKWPEAQQWHWKKPTTRIDDGESEDELDCEDDAAIERLTKNVTELKV